LIASDADQGITLTGYLLLFRKLFPPSGAFILGIFLLFIALCIWVVALRFIRFAVGFPIYLSLSIGFSTLYSTLISKEGLGLFQYLGLFVLILAIILLARN
jgi:multidrug transporter EmrE-like cation transporter